jgi:hypothetical protein
MSLLKALKVVDVRYQDGSGERRLSIGETVPEKLISPPEVEAYLARGEVKRVDAVTAKEKEAVREAEGEVEPAKAGVGTTDPSTLNVEDASAMIAAATSTDQLDYYKKAEKAGKDRVGVYDAIDKRRAELKDAAKS